MRYDCVRPKHRSSHRSILSAYNRDARYARLEAPTRAVPMWRRVKPDSQQNTRDARLKMVLVLTSAEN